MQSTVYYPTKSNGVLRLVFDEHDTRYLFAGKWFANRRTDGEITLFMQKQVARKVIRTWLHRLIADKHVPRPTPAHTVCLFANGDCYDYRRANLLWVTPLEAKARAAAKGGAGMTRKAEARQRAGLQGV